MSLVKNEKEKLFECLTCHDLVKKEGVATPYIPDNTKCLCNNCSDGLLRAMGVKKK